ncbi:uncharacterized protein LOC121601933 [Anopheles merus]|uniref:uncharacterized protein LOC121601933 n=1 Tax=Anopheles merus TaxID=30066 RepID=UPI001BE41D0E|nr:uncharacterized protein LOC121601933 [Anopheles merus]
MCVGACAGAASERLRATTCLIEEKRVRYSPGGKTHIYTRMDVTVKRKLLSLCNGLRAKFTKVFRDEKHSFNSTSTASRLSATSQTVLLQLSAAVVGASLSNGSDGCVCWQTERSERYNVRLVSSPSACRPGTLKVKSDEIVMFSAR